MPLLFESRRMSSMPKMIDPELKARAVRLVSEHRGEYPTLTACDAAVNVGYSPRCSLTRRTALAFNSGSIIFGILLILLDSNRSGIKTGAPQTASALNSSLKLCGATCYASLDDPGNSIQWATNPRSIPHSIRHGQAGRP